MQLLTIQYFIIFKSKIVTIFKHQAFPICVNDGGKVAGDYIAKCAESFD